MRFATTLMVAGALAVAIAPATGGSAQVAGGGRIPQARALPACAAAGPYWPTETLALGDGSAWVACKEQARIVRVRLPSGRRTATVQLDAPVTAVAVGLGSVWALDDRATPHPHRPAHESRPKADSARRECRVQHLDRRRLGLGRRRSGRGRPADLARDEHDGRAHPGRRRARGHGLRGEARVGDHAPGQRAPSHRHDDERRDAPGDGRGRRRRGRAPRAAGRRLVDHGPRRARCSRSIRRPVQSVARWTSAARGSTS